jgi:hypothetical protein
MFPSKFLSSTGAVFDFNKPTGDGKMGLIGRINSIAHYATAPIRRVHAMDRGYTEKVVEMTNDFNKDPQKYELPGFKFPARATLPPKTIRSNYTIPVLNSSKDEMEFETISEEHTVRFPPMILDTQQKADTYLKNLSAPVPKGSLFPHAIVQPDGINFENLHGYNQAYAELLRSSSLAKKDSFRDEINAMADKLLQVPARLNEEAMKRYKTYDYYHADNEQARYLSQAQAELVVADQMRLLSEHAYGIAKKKEVDQEARLAFHGLGEHFNTIKRNHVSHASEGLMDDDSEYKEAEDDRFPIDKKNKLNPGSDSQTRVTTGLKVGIKGGISYLNAKATALFGITSFGQKSTGRDLETSVVSTKGALLALDGELSTGTDFLTGRAFVNGTLAFTGGKQFKAENPVDRNKGEFEQDKRDRRNRFFKGAGPDARNAHATWQRATNTLGKVFAGNPGKSPDQPFFVTQEKVGKGKFNQQEIIDGAAKVDGYFGSDDETIETFRSLSSLYHPTLEERFKKIDEIDQIKPSDIEKHAPGAHYPTAISGMPANRYHNSKQVIAPADQFDASFTIGGQGKMSGFKPRNMPGDVEPSPVAPGIDLQLSLSKRTSSNTQQRHKSLLEMTTGKLLVGDIYSILEETKRIYRESNPRASSSSSDSSSSGDSSISHDSGGHPLHRARDLYTMASLDLQDDGSAADWTPDDMERGFYGNPQNIPFHTRQAIVAMRAGQLDAVLPLRETTRHFRNIESELKQFYVDATKVNPHFDSPSGREELEKMNQRYAQGGYRFPRKIKRDDMDEFFNSVHNDLIGSVMGVVADSTAFNYEGVRQLRNASEEKKAEFRAGVEENRQAYSILFRIGQQDYLPSSIARQRENDIVARGDSEKDEYRVRSTASVKFGATNDTGVVDDFLKVNLDGQRYNATAEIRAVKQKKNINPMRLGEMIIVTLSGSYGGHVHSGIKGLTEKFKDVQDKQLMEDVRRSTPLDMFFGKSGSAVEYQIWVPDTSTLEGTNKVTHALARKTDMEFQSTNVDIAPLEDAAKFFTGVPVVAALATRYSNEEKIAVNSKIGAVPTEVILAMNKFGPNLGEKSTGKMHSFDKIRENLRSEESQVHLKSFFSDFNAIPKIVHLFQVAALDEPDVPYNDFHNLLGGYGAPGERLRKNFVATAHYSPTSKSDPFDAPSIDHDLYQDLIGDAKSASWPAYDPDLIARLERMSPEEQLDFYTMDSEGQKILQTFWKVANTANAHASAMKGANEIGYTLVAHEQLIRRLPVKDDKNPSANEKSFVQGLAGGVADFFTGYAGFRAVPMPDTAVHGDRRVPTFSTRMVFPSSLESLKEESFEEPSNPEGIEVRASPLKENVAPSPDGSSSRLQNSFRSHAASDGTQGFNALSMAPSSVPAQIEVGSSAATPLQALPDQAPGNVDVSSMSSITHLPPAEQITTAVIHGSQGALESLAVDATTRTTLPSRASQPQAIVPSDTRSMAAVEIPPSHAFPLDAVQSVTTGATAAQADMALSQSAGRSAAEGMLPAAGYQPLQPAGQPMSVAGSSAYVSSAQLPGSGSIINSSSTQPNGSLSIAADQPSNVISGAFVAAATSPSEPAQNGSITQPQTQQGPTSSPLGLLLGSGMRPPFDAASNPPLVKPSEPMFNASVVGSSIAELRPLVTSF